MQAQPRDTWAFTSRSRMPYAFALAGFALFFAIGAIGTAASFVFASLRGLPVLEAVPRSRRTDLATSHFPYLIWTDRWRSISLYLGCANIFAPTPPFKCWGPGYMMSWRLRNVPPRRASPAESFT